MALASAFARENSKYITAYAIAGDQYPDMSKHYNVGGVPHTVVNEVHAVVGLMPDEPFAKFIKALDKSALGQYAQVYAKGATDDNGYCPDEDAVFGPDAEAASAKAAESVLGEDAAEAAESYGLIEAKGDEFNPDLLILGGGPAGLTAAVYAARAGLTVTLLDHGMLGGQVALTPQIENYPGFKSISGTKLVGNMIAQAQEYAHLRGNMQITNLEQKDGKFIAHTSNGQYSGKTLLLATGASWRKLNVPGEAVLSGRGVHYCATCDGYMYVGKRVIIIGGGNTALTDALHLKNLGMEVTLVHRRDKFRAEQALVNSVNKHGINIIWNSTVKEVLGREKVTGLILTDVNTNAETTVETDGVFVSIGQDPNSRPAMAVRAALTPERYIQVDAKGRTNVPRVYAAGDVTGGFMQIVTATASGALAANTAFEDLQTGE